MKPCAASFRLLHALALASATLLTTSIGAQSGANMDEALVENTWAKVTRGDYEAELLRLPPDLRGGFGASAKRVAELLDRLLLTKSLAAQARASGLDKDPETRSRVALEVDRVYAGLQIAKIEEDAGKAFDARRSQFEARAHELYLVGRDKYRVTEQAAVSHILFETKKRSKEEALRLAQDAREKILAGTDFNDLATQVSDDPSVQQNRGRIDYFDKPRMDPAFADAAFALRKVGDISEPVLSSFGYHLIRLDGRHAAGVRSFDEVKESILSEQRAQYINEQREQALAPLRNDKDLKSNRSAIDALVIKIDPELIKKSMDAAQPK
jgi:peptidyl-prolyl cis-trans isomerase C